MEAFDAVCGGLNRTGRTPHWFTARALEDALIQGGCPICQAQSAAERRHLHSFLYEGMMSPLARQDFLDGGGFCRRHFWKAKQIEEQHWADGFGVSILCENLLEKVQEDLYQFKITDDFKRRGLLKIGRTAKRPFRLTPGKGCVTCAMLRDSVEHLLSVIEELLEDAGFRDRYTRAGGLCLSHLQAGLIQWKSTGTKEFAKQTAENRIETLIAELREFQRKHDYQYKAEPRGAEWSSPERAIEFLVGRMPERSL